VPGVRLSIDIEDRACHIVRAEAISGGRGSTNIWLEVSPSLSSKTRLAVTARPGPLSEPAVQKERSGS